MNTFKIMIRGLSVAPWIIESCLGAGGFRCNAQVKERDDTLGHIAVVELASFRDQPITVALGTDPAARNAVASFLRYAVGVAYQVHLLICRADSEDVSETIQLTPGTLKMELPRLVDHAGVLVLMQAEGQ